MRQRAGDGAGGAGSAPGHGGDGGDTAATQPPGGDGDRGGGGEGGGRGRRRRRGEGLSPSSSSSQDGSGLEFDEGDDSPVVYGALGQAEEQPVYDLPKEWKTMVSTLCLRTNFEPAELADLFQRFRQLAGELLLLFGSHTTSVPLLEMRRAGRPLGAAWREGKGCID